MLQEQHHTTAAFCSNAPPATPPPPPGSALKARGGPVRVPLPNRPNGTPAAATPCSSSRSHNRAGAVVHDNNKSNKNSNVAHHRAGDCAAAPVSSDAGSVAGNGCSVRGVATSSTAESCAEQQRSISSRGASHIDAQHRTPPVRKVLGGQAQRALQSAKKSPSAETLCGTCGVHDAKSSAVAAALAANVTVRATPAAKAHITAEAAGSLQHGLGSARRVPHPDAVATTSKKATSQAPSATRGDGAAAASSPSRADGSAVARTTSGAGCDMSQCSSAMKSASKLSGGASRVLLADAADGAQSLGFSSSPALGRHPNRELAQLLKDSNDAVAPASAAAAVASSGGDTAGPTTKPCGSIQLLSPVRASKALQNKLGTMGKVLTPVRRSARKPDAARLAVTPVAALLEATNFCYTPNAAVSEVSEPAVAAQQQRLRDPEVKNLSFSFH